MRKHRSNKRRRRPRVRRPRVIYEQVEDPHAKHRALQAYRILLERREPSEEERQLENR